MTSVILKSLLYFVLAGLFEIGGGYLVWLWLREGKGFPVALLGWFLLMIYGIIPTLQPTHFGRVYAAYSGIFILLSLLWGWRIDHVRPDYYDWLGCALAIAGVLVMMYAPRS
ncbi:YnfA family protein [Synechococcus moorigangaii CMS01]|nr:YnfA family protein [Synechococcus moorigangaii CMS01]